MGSIGSSGRTLEDKIKYINPYYKPDASAWDKEGFNNNCVKCAFAFEENMRGGDVQANPYKFGYLQDVNNTNLSEIAKGIGKKGDIWDVGANTRQLAIKRIEDTMDMFGKNSRAFLFLYHKDGKHLVNVIHNNGKLNIVDSQSGKYGDLKTMLKYYTTNRAELVRVDDATIPQEWKDWAYKRRK